MKEKALYGEFFKADFFYINYKKDNNKEDIFKLSSINQFLDISDTMPVIDYENASIEAQNNFYNEKVFCSDCRSFRKYLAETEQNGLPLKQYLAYVKKFNIPVITFKECKERELAKYSDNRMEVTKQVESKNESKMTINDFKKEYENENCYYDESFFSKNNMKAFNQKLSDFQVKELDTAIKSKYFPERIDHNIFVAWAKIYWDYGHIGMSVAFLDDSSHKRLSLENLEEFIKDFFNTEGATK